MKTKDYVIVSLLCAILLGCVAIIQLANRDTAIVLSSTEYLLDDLGCRAAQRLGAELQIEGGLCIVKVDADHGQYLTLAGGIRVSQEHILGWRPSK